MTSPQWFEDIEGAFTGLTFVDLGFDDGSGILVAQDRPQQWFKTSDVIEAVVGLYDPWDEDHYIRPRRSIWLIPHEGLSKTECWTLSRQVQRASDEVSPTGLDGDLPAKFSPLRLDSDHVRVTAFYREIGDYAGRHTDRYAGEGVEYPFIVRLVELEGLEGEVDLIVAGPVAKAFKANLLGQIEQELTPEAADPDALYATPEELSPFGIVPQRLRFSMRANEIATLYLDLIPGRKQTRDLDAKREIWATVHRVD
jgi:alpha-mannosidase